MAALGTEDCQDYIRVKSWVPVCDVSSAIWSLFYNTQIWNKNVVSVGRFQDDAGGPDALWGLNFHTCYPLGIGFLILQCKACFRSPRAYMCVE